MAEGFTAAVLKQGRKLSGPGAAPAVTTFLSAGSGGPRRQKPAISGGFRSKSGRPEAYKDSLLRQNLFVYRGVENVL